MIITKLAGGLGNQMFQYALGRQLALNNQTDLLLDLSFFTSKHNRAECDTREFSLANFNIKANIATPSNVKKLSTNRYLKRLGLPKRTEIIEKKSNVFQPELLKLKGDFILEGAWQTAKYFSAIRDIIIHDFSLKQELNLNPELRVWLADGPVVALHCRRGDYVSSQKVNQTHGVCSLDYYQRALQSLVKYLGEFKLLIFSDDLDWSKTNLNFAWPTKFAADYQLADYQEIILMSRCQHHIIANSSFSWWRAWLNVNPHKIVVAPVRWYHDSTKETKDMLPDNWIKI